MSTRNPEHSASLHGTLDGRLQRAPPHCGLAPQPTLQAHPGPPRPAQAPYHLLCDVDIGLSKRFWQELLPERVY